jgi:prepilin-type N-terminal cleavage/methylation domain-containing protein
VDIIPASRSCRKFPVCEQGFTLLELLISIALVLVLTIALTTVFRIALRSWESATESVDENQRQRERSYLLNQQISSISGIKVDSWTFFTGEPCSMQFISPYSLRLVQNIGLALIRYKCVRDKAGAYSLIEQEQKYLGPDQLRNLQGQEQENLWARQNEQELESNLADIHFEYFDPDSSRWVSQWSGESSARLPTAISITISYRSDKGKEHGKHMVIPVHSKPYDKKINYTDHFNFEKNTPSNPPPPPNPLPQSTE